MNVTVPDTVVADMLRFIETSSVLGKRAVDRVTELEKAGSDASPKVATVVDALIAGKLISTEKKAEAVRTIGSHSGALDVLHSAITKLAEAKATLLEKQASMGHGERTDGDTPVHSASSVITGLRTSEKKASDVAFERGLGIHAGA